MSHLPGRTTQISQLLLVELVRLYSNLQARPETLLHFRRSALSHRRVCEETAPLVPQRVERRLGAEMIKRVMSEYAGGISTTRLASQYGIGKGTLLRLLHEHDVMIRHQHRKRGKRLGLWRRPLYVHRLVGFTDVKPLESPDQNVRVAVAANCDKAFSIIKAAGTVTILNAQADRFITAVSCLVKYGVQSACSYADPPVTG